MLLPWNAYISAKPYFQSRLCDEDSQENEIGQNIEAWFSTLYNGASVLSLAIVIIFQFASGKKNTTGFISKACVSSIDGESIESTSEERWDVFRMLSVSWKQYTKVLSKFCCCGSSKHSLSGCNPTRTSATNPIGKFSGTIRSDSNMAWYLVMIPLAVYFIVFFSTTLLVLVPNTSTLSTDTSESPLSWFSSRNIAVSNEFFVWFTLTAFTLCGIATSIATAGIVGTAGLLVDPEIGISPFFNGQAVGGLVVALGNGMATFWDTTSSTAFWEQHCHYMQYSGEKEDDNSFLLVLADDYDDAAVAACTPYSNISWSTALYFGASCIILAACIVGYAYVEECTATFRQQRKLDSTCWEESLSLREDDESAINAHEVERSRLLDTRGIDNRCNSYESVVARDEDGELQQEQLNFQNSLKNDINKHNTAVLVWDAVEGPAISLFWTYFVTLAIFPGWTSELSSIKQCSDGSGRMRNDLFTPMSFIIFNTGDLIGRIISSYIPMDRVTSNSLVLAAISRFAFFPFFLFCHADPGDAASNSISHLIQGWMVPSDVFSWSVQFLFAGSNGLITTVSFSFSSGLVENRTKPQQIASAILNFALCLGLLGGSLFSFPILKFTTGLP